MAKRNKHFTYQSSKRIPTRYTNILVPLLVKRFTELKEFLDAEEINFDLYCRCVDEFELLKMFSKEYNITLPVDLCLDILTYY